MNYAILINLYNRFGGGGLLVFYSSTLPHDPIWEGTRMCGRGNSMHEYYSEVQGFR